MNDDVPVLFRMSTALHSEWDALPQGRAIRSESGKYRVDFRYLVEYSKLGQLAKTVRREIQL